MTTDLCSLSAVDLVDAYRRKQLSPVEVARAVLRRMEELNPSLNAFVLVNEQLVEEAKASEARWTKGMSRGLLDGVPVSVKDLLLTKGWPTLRGSKTVDPAGPWNDDAPAVARLREQGALLLGKTATPEFGWKGVTDSPLAGITRNPWDRSKTPGGSSGGAAAAVAAGLGPLALGTDGGGSIRIPCSFTGLFGIKASFGRVPAWPLSPFGTVAHVGPISRTVADAALLLNVIALPDARDWHALPPDLRDYRTDLDHGIEGLRIAYSSTLGYVDNVDAEVSSIVSSALKTFEASGARVEDKHPGFENPDKIFRAHWFSGAAFLLKDLPADRRKLVDPGLLEVAAQGAKITAFELLEAQMQRGALGAHMNLFHRDYDLLVTPTLAVPAFEAGQEYPGAGDGKRWTDWTPFTYPFNLTQQPAATVPCGFTRAGLPVGLQIVGAKYADALVLRAARAFEAAKPWPFPGNLPAAGKS